MSCPNCNTDFDINESDYQVNDNNEKTYCSYECSSVGTILHISKLLLTKDSLSKQELQTIITNT